MNCQNHPGVEAARKCLACGADICKNCVVTVKNEPYCKSCVSRKLEGDAGGRQRRSPSLAATLSFIIGGAGQMYNGQIGKGLFILFTAWLIIPWIYGIFDAYGTAKKINEGTVKPRGRAGCGTAVIVAAVIFVALIPIAGLLAAIAIPNFMKARQEAMKSSEKRVQIRQEASRPAADKQRQEPALKAGVKDMLKGPGREVYRVYLKNGHRFEASIEKKTDTTYVFKIGNGTFEVGIADIERMKEME